MNSLLAECKSANQVDQIRAGVAQDFVTSMVRAPIKIAKIRKAPLAFDRLLRALGAICYCLVPLKRATVPPATARDVVDADLWEDIMKRIMLIAIGMLAFAFYSTASQAATTSLTLTSITLSKSTGAITVTGTIVCTAGDNFAVFTNQIQANGVRRGFANSGGSPPLLAYVLAMWIHG